MTTAVLIIIAVLLLACVVMYFILRGQAKKLAAQRDENKRLHEAFAQVEKKAEYLQKALDGTLEAEKEAADEKQSLASTDDAGLSSRANALFGVPERKKPS
jgi:Tfp pilus assembly protein PilO